MLSLWFRMNYRSSQNLLLDRSLGKGVAGGGITDGVCISTGANWGWRPIIWFYLGSVIYLFIYPNIAPSTFLWMKEEAMQSLVALVPSGFECINEQKLSSLYIIITFESNAPWPCAAPFRPAGWKGVACRMGCTQIGTELSQMYCISICESMRKLNEMKSLINDFLIFFIHMLLLPLLLFGCSFCILFKGSCCRRKINVTVGTLH